LKKANENRQTGKARAVPTKTEAVSTESASDLTIQAVAAIERQAYESRSWMDRFAATTTRWAGSTAAIVVHMIWFFAWLAINLNAFPEIKPFDPFPFSLLTMVVSLEAIFLTLFVLITQNRMSKEADRRAELDLQVNLLAEREATVVLQMLKQISEKLDIPVKKDLKDLIKEIDVDELSKKLENVLPQD